MDEGSNALNHLLAASGVTISTVVMIVAMLGMIVSAAVDIDIFGLVSTVILAISWFPLGYMFIKGDLE